MPLRDAPKKKPVIKDNLKFTAETFIGMYLHYNNVVFFPMNSKQGILFRLSDQYRSLKNVVYVNGHMIHFYNGFNVFSALLYKEESIDETNSSFKVLLCAVDLCLPLDFTNVF